MNNNNTEEYDHYKYIYDLVKTLEGWSKNRPWWDRLSPRQQHCISLTIDKVNSRFNHRNRQKAAGYAPCEDPEVYLD